VPRIRIALASLVALALVGTGSAFAVTNSTAAKAKPKTTIVKVKASEFEFVLSQKSIAKPGKVIFKVTNTGKITHNFVILSGINKATKVLQPKQSTTMTVTFKKKAKYTYECTIGEHAEHGMIGTFLVK
jgi:plastocyanin